MKRKIDLSIISEYRSELMGYGILFIMLSHALASWMQIPVAGTIVGKLTTLVHTQGFFFLSGFGLYYSFLKNNDIRQFYKRRLLRMYIPFLIMSFPVYLFDYITRDLSFADYLLVQSSLAYYILGKGAMWYISATLFLYAIFPLVYKLMFGKRLSVAMNLFCVLGIWLLVAISLYHFHIEYYQQVERLVAKFPMFVLGIYTGYLAKTHQAISVKHVFSLLVLMCILIIADRYNRDFTMYYKDVATLLGMMVISVVLKKSSGGGKIGNALKWLGKYSLELYIFHMLIKNWMMSILALCGIDGSLTLLRIVVPIALILSLLICQPVHNGINKLLNNLSK